MRIETKKEFFNKANNFSVTYKKTYNPSSKSEIDFILECFEDKCIGIYSKDMYPLIQSRDDSDFTIIKIKEERFTYYEKNYVLEYKYSNIVAIYNNKGRKIFSSKENQRVEPVPSPYSLLVNIAENNNVTILYDVLKSKEIFKGSYCNTLFSIQDNFYFENKDNEIKAIYSNDYNLILKSDLGYFKFINSSSISCMKYILEYSCKDEKCHSIYKYNSIISSCELLYSDENLDLSINDYYQISDNENSDLLIIGSINFKIKSIIFLNSQKNIILRSKTLDIDDERWYFEINKSEKLIQIFFQTKCIKILNYNFNTIVSVGYKNNHIQSTYFVIDEYNSYIKKIKNGKCIAYYTYNSEEVIKTKRDDINIITCSSKNNKKIFLFMDKKNCIKICYEHYNKALKVQKGITYKILKDFNGMLICGYVVKNGKNIGIFDFDLNIIEKFEKDYSLEILTYDTYNVIKEDYHGLRYHELCLKLIYLKYDSDGKCRQIFNEFNESLFTITNINKHLKPFDNKCILIFNDNKCTGLLLVKNFKIYDMVQLTKENHVIIPNLTKQGYALFKIYNTIKHKYVSLFTLNKGDFIELINSNDGYEHVYTIDDFLLVSSNHNSSLQLINIKDMSKEYCNNNLFTYNGYFKLDFINKDFAIIYKIVNKKIVAVYLIDNFAGFDKILTGEDIKPINIKNNIFFNVDGKLYNIVGNLV